MNKNPYILDLRDHKPYSAPKLRLSVIIIDSIAWFSLFAAIAALCAWILPVVTGY